MKTLSSYISESILSSTKSGRKLVEIPDAVMQAASVCVEWLHREFGADELTVELRILNRVYGEEADSLDIYINALDIEKFTTSSQDKLIKSLKKNLKLSSRLIATYPGTSSLWVVNVSDTETDNVLFRVGATSLNGCTVIIRLKKEISELHDEIVKKIKDAVEK